MELLFGLLGLIVFFGLGAFLIIFLFSAGPEWKDDFYNQKYYPPKGKDPLNPDDDDKI